MKVNEIGNKIEELPEHLRPQVLDYIEFLMSKHWSKKSVRNQDRGKFKFDWEGGLSKLKTQYTSVALQHKASDWR
jgi:hypothetical protein